MRWLSGCDRVEKHQNILITRSTGVGKTYRVCALAEKACRDGYSALWRPTPRLLHELAVARADGSNAELLSHIAETGLLVRDDWASRRAGGLLQTLIAAAQAPDRARSQNCDCVAVGAPRRARKRGFVRAIPHIERSSLAPKSEALLRFLIGELGGSA